MKARIKRHLVILSLTATILGATIAAPTVGHASIFGFFDDTVLNIKSDTKGLPLTISTYDNGGQKIDQIKTKSAKIHTDSAMSKTDSNGNEKSSVIDIDYGKQRITHVGSTMIAYEGLKNYQDEYAQKHNITDQNKSVPLLNAMHQDFSNQWNSQKRVVVIRSQAGNPIATFAGNNVSIHNTEMKNTTKFVIDGHRLIVYRADYTVYPTASLK